ncbi:MULTISPECIES: DUF1697 domain-containing protein [Chitinophagaceae]
MSATTTYISILRGINVSGKNIVKMEALQQLCADLGFRCVHTYIQSGNIVFNYHQDAGSTVNAMLQSSIAQRFGSEIPVITLTKEEWAQIIISNPFTKDNKSIGFLHVSFLSELPDPKYAELLQQIPLNNDSYFHVGKTVYLYCPDGYGKTKLTNSILEKKLKVNATTRNWKTTIALSDIADKICKHK